MPLSARNIGILKWKTENKKKRGERSGGRYKRKIAQRNT